MLLHLTNRSASRAQVDFVALASTTASGAPVEPPVGPLRVSLVLGDEVRDGIAGRCGERLVASSECAPGRSGQSFVCRAP